MALDFLIKACFPLLPPCERMCFSIYYSRYDFPQTEVPQPAFSNVHVFFFYQDVSCTLNLFTRKSDN